ncbi:hypothetical protein MMC14_008512 [Varicellaria rhodocarpa]|nr:hypothetical protein [Varicellaria rhodocarpa]
MGLFSSPVASHTSPKASSDGAYEAPDRSARRACWTARDAFFTCLDQNGIIDSIRNDGEAKKCCGGELKGLEKDCAASWVTYFQQRRVMEYNKKKTLEKLKAEGAKPMPEGMGPPQGPAGLSR